MPHTGHDKAHTLRDEHGNTYKLIGSVWLKVLTGLSISSLVGLIVVFAFLIDNIHRVEDALKFSDKVAQRNQALGDIAASRAKANIWAFDKTCELVHKDGQDCMPNPQWYADPKRYPLIADDPFGAGLFPPKPDILPK